MIQILIKPIWRILILWLLATGILDFLLMGLDKDRAIYEEWRISEMTLLTISALGGWWGLLAGAYKFNYKESKVLFMSIVFLIAALWIYLLKQLIAVYGPPLVIP